MCSKNVSRPSTGVHPPSFDFRGPARLALLFVGYNHVSPLILWALTLDYHLLSLKSGEKRREGGYVPIGAEIRNQESKFRNIGRGKSLYHRFHGISHPCDNISAVKKDITLVKISHGCDISLSTCGFFEKSLDGTLVWCRVIFRRGCSILCKCDIFFNLRYFHQLRGGLEPLLNNLGFKKTIYRRKSPLDRLKSSFYYKLRLVAMKDDPIPFFRNFISLSPQLFVFFAPRLQ